MSWLYNDKEITELPEGVEAFVYKIEFSDGTFYIGKKNRYSIRRTKVAGKVRKKVVTTERWANYESSSDVVKAKIAKGVPFTKEIIEMCSTKGMATYLEVVYMIKYNVLCDTNALNKSILGKFFRCYED